MARTRRVKSMAEGVAHYHLVARTGNKQFLFRKARTKDMLVDLVKRAAAFSGIALEAFVMMDNHIHVLCTVTRTDKKVPEAEIVRRVRVLKGDKAADELARHLEELAAAGFTATLEAELERYRRRMDDISEFMKTMKELFAIWFKREFDFTGSVWSGAYKSTMVEGGSYFRRCRRYIQLNPVRAGIVTQVKDYRWVWVGNASESEVFPGCLPDAALLRRVPQFGAGKIYGSEGFVRRWIAGLGDRFSAAHVSAHAVGELGFSSHGWRLAKKEEEARAAA